jgi:hypothetical protein
MQSSICKRLAFSISPLSIALKINTGYRRTGQALTHLEHFIQSVLLLRGLHLLLEKTIMLEVRFITGVSVVGMDAPIIAPPNTTFRISFGSTLKWSRIWITGVRNARAKAIACLWSDVRRVCLPLSIKRFDLWGNRKE